jgi:ankyrin repeat protein
MLIQFKKIFKSIKIILLHLTCFLLLSQDLFANDNNDNDKNLVDSSARGNYQEVVTLLEKNANPNYAFPEEHGTTPLIAAVCGGYSDIAHELLDNGANPNIADDYGTTALMCASLYGLFDMVKELLINGADPDYVNNQGGAAIMYINIPDGEPEKNLNIVEELLKHGANPNQKDKYGYNPPLDQLSKSCGISKLLRKYGAISRAQRITIRNLAKITNQNHSGGLCLGLTTLWLYTKFVDFTLQKSNIYNGAWFKNTIASINDFDENTNLNNEQKTNIDKFAHLVYFLYSRYDDLDVSIPLSELDTNDKIITKKNSIMPAFTIAQKQKLSDLLKNIIFEGELIEVTCHLKDDVFSFHILGVFKHNGVYYFYDPNNSIGEIEKNNSDELADIIFYVASNYGKKQSIVISLIIYGTNDLSHDYSEPKNVLENQNDQSLNALGLIDSAYNRNLNHLRFYLNKIDPNTSDESGSTAILSAAKNGQIKVLTELLEKNKLDLDKEDSSGLLTPIIVATITNRPEIVEKLLEYGASPNKRNIVNHTAISLAAQVGNIEIVRKIIDAIKKALNNGSLEKEKDGLRLDLRNALYYAKKKEIVEEFSALWHEIWPD